MEITEIAFKIVAIRLCFDFFESSLGVYQGLLQETLIFEYKRLAAEFGQL